MDDISNAHLIMCCTYSEHRLDIQNKPLPRIFRKPPLVRVECPCRLGGNNYVTKVLSSNPQRSSGKADEGYDIIHIPTCSKKLHLPMINLVTSTTGCCIGSYFTQGLHIRCHDPDHLGLLVRLGTEINVPVPKTITRTNGYNTLWCPLQKHKKSMVCNSVVILQALT